MNNKMKKINEIIKSKSVQYIIVACAGLLVGRLLFSSSESPAPATHEGHEMHEGHSHDLVQDETGVWTFSMHPQIRQDKPGKCPICAMDLIPVRKGSGGGENSDPKAIQLSEEAAALADVQTSKVSRKNPVKTVRLYGKIAPNEQSLQSQTAHVGGRIEQLNINFTGESVRAGQTLAVLYSPELFTAQQELLEAIKMKQPALIQAAREKLRLWKMTNAQIEAIEQSGSVSPLVEIKANVSGIVMTKRVNQGDYVASGAVLFDIANLSSVWAMFDTFEVDLPFLNRGDQVHFTLQALPGKTYTGRIAFIDPIINPSTRTARVRVEVPNSHMELKPEMYATDLVALLKAEADFDISVAAYPEGHPEAATIFEDLDHLKEKVDAGCEFLTTQMFFDNNILYNFMYKALKKGIDVPIVAGIMPVTNASQIKRITSLSGNMVPPRFLAIVDRFGDNPAAMRQAGIAYATEQIIDLIANGVNHVHIYTMNKPDVAGEILDNLSNIYVR